MARTVKVKNGKQLRSLLLRWYDASRRDLPWRRTSDAYRVWIAEVMLQQTRVPAVMPYYERWLATFPDTSALAAAELHDVLKCWEGLGYYARARNLHRAAQLVRERHAGQLPGDYDALRALPGIGEYTAGAIASIAFGAPTPAVDGNVRRVLARLFDVAMPDPQWLRARAAELMSRRRPGDFNQALMDLGSTLCTPRSPRCTDCPLQSICKARNRGTVERRPGRGQHRLRPLERVTTIVACTADARVLLRKRPAPGLLGGLWEFPDTGDTPPDSYVRRLLGVRSRAVPLGAVTHDFTHRRVIYEVRLYRIEAACEVPEGYAWVAPAALHRYALSVAQRRIEALLLAEM